jgi:hypothetical protein
MQMVRKLNALNTSVSISANQTSGATGGAMAKSPSIPPAIIAAATLTASPRQRALRAASQPSAGSCTTSISRSANSTVPSAASETPCASA